LPHIDRDLDVLVTDDGLCSVCQRPSSLPICPICRDQALNPEPPTDQVKLIEQEVARRELVRRHLVALAQYFQPTYIPDWVHYDIAARLERFLQRVIRKESPRLIINIQPRVGKSQLGSIFFPAYALGLYPWLEFILSSHTLSLATQFSRRVRALLDDPRYQEIFRETRLDPDNRSALGWKTSRQGGFLPAGVGGSITGHGAHILVIEDYLKNAQEARSLTTRDGLEQWYTSTAYTRLAPGGGVLIIATRWHLDDLTGRLEQKALEDPEADQFEIVRYPAISDFDEYRTLDGRILTRPEEGATLLRSAGEVVNPKRWPLKRMLKIKAAVSPEDWASLYQQNPAYAAGALFQDDMFRFCEMKDIPSKDKLVFYTAWDTATKVETRNNESVGITGGVDADDNLWLADVQAGRWTSDLLVERIIDVYEEYGSDMTGVEETQATLALKPFLDKRIDERGVRGFDLDLMPTKNRDKYTRAQPIAARMRQGKVIIPKDAPWAAELIRQLKGFLVLKEDDYVDALAWLGYMLNQMLTPRQGKPKRTESWRDRLPGLVSRRRTSWMAR